MFLTSNLLFFLEVDDVISPLEVKMMKVEKREEWSELIRGLSKLKNGEAWQWPSESIILKTQYTDPSPGQWSSMKKNVQINEQSVDI